MYINKPSVTKIEEVDRINLLHSTKVCFKRFVTWIINRHNFFNICSRCIIQSVVEGFE